MMLNAGTLDRIRRAVDESEFVWEEFSASNGSSKYTIVLRANPQIRLSVTEQNPIEDTPLSAVILSTQPRPSTPTTFRLSVFRAPHPSGASDGADTIDSENALLSCVDAWLYGLPSHLRALARAQAQAAADQQVADLLQPLKIADEPFTKDELAGLHEIIQRLRKKLEEAINASILDKDENRHARDDLRRRLEKLEAAAPRVDKPAFFKILFAILLGLSPVIDGIHKLDHLVREIGLLPP